MQRRHGVQLTWILRAVVAGLLLTMFSWTAAPVSAQQSLFNVPSTTLTPPEKIFFQEQMNFTNTGQSNTTFDYGLGGGWEMGMNVLNASYYGDFGPTGGVGGNNESVLLNLQHVFDFEQTFYLEVGIQAGASVIESKRTTEASGFGWVTGRYHHTEGIKGEYIVGIYNGTETYLGPNHGVGFMLGTEIPMIPDKLTFIADYVSGDTDVSVAVVGLQFHMDPKTGWLISVGAQIPSPHSGNPYGVVVEFTKNPESRPEDVASLLRRKVIPVSSRSAKLHSRF